MRHFQKPDPDSLQNITAPVSNLSEVYASLSCAAIDAVWQCNNNARALQQFFALAVHHSSCDPNRHYAQIHESLSSVDCSVVNEYIDNGGDILPGNDLIDISDLSGIDDTYQAIIDLWNEARDRGQLYDWYRPRPDIRQWVGEVIDKVQQVISQSRFYSSKHPERGADLFIGTALTLDNFMSLHRETPTHGVRALLFSFQGLAMWEVRGALYAGLARNFLENLKTYEARKVFLRHLKSFSERPINVEKLPDSSICESVVRCVKWLAVHRGEFWEASRTAHRFMHIPMIAGGLSGHSPAFKSDPDN
jgi:hypothetical protein